MGEEEKEKQDETKPAPEPEKEQQIDITAPRPIDKVSRNSTEPGKESIANIKEKGRE
jgi:hypothetical protein